jgi:hypothetical protein
MEEAIEACRAKLRWAEQRLAAGDETAQGPEAPPEEHPDEGTGDRPPEE